MRLTIRRSSGGRTAERTDDGRICRCRVSDIGRFGGHRKHKGELVTRCRAIAVLGVLGLSSMALMPLPDVASAPVPPLLLRALTFLQPAILLALATWAGCKLAARLDLKTPLIDAAITRSDPWPVVKAQLGAALVCAPIAAAVLSGWWLALRGYLPERFLVEAEKQALPLLVRIGYGGIVEEILVRWGLMSSVAYGAWRLIARDVVVPVPPRAVFVFAIVVTAVLFGVGHLPYARFLAGVLTPWLVFYVVGGNAIFGLLAGWLFWRRGLEAAIFAHMLLHCVLFLTMRALDG